MLFAGERLFFDSDSVFLFQGKESINMSMKDLKPFYNLPKFPNKYRFILILVFLVLDGIAKIVLYRGLPDVIQQIIELIEKLLNL